MYAEIKATKPWVKFGISPFGIGRPGRLEQIKGFDQYEALYADAEKWFAEGWVDYFTPQLYWKIGPPPQSYAALLYWWNTQNKAERHLWPGNYTSRVAGADGKSWPVEELIAQIWVTRAQPGATGNVHFSMKALQGESALTEALRTGAYKQPALVPSSPWLAKPSDAAPRNRSLLSRNPQIAGKFRSPRPTSPGCGWFARSIPTTGRSRSCPAAGENTNSPAATNRSRLWWCRRSIDWGRKAR